eukprot:5571024-Pleurochrysis_carterae.AAC.1
MKRRSAAAARARGRRDEAAWATLLETSGGQRRQRGRTAREWAYVWWRGLRGGRWNRDAGLG